MSTGQSVPCVHMYTCTYVYMYMYMYVLDGQSLVYVCTVHMVTIIRVHVLLRLKRVTQHKSQGSHEK